MKWKETVHSRLLPLFAWDGWERTQPNLTASVNNQGLRIRDTKYKSQVPELEQMFLPRQRQGLERDGSSAEPGPEAVRGSGEPAMALLAAHS